MRVLGPVVLSVSSASADRSPGYDLVLVAHILAAAVALAAVAASGVAALAARRPGPARPAVRTYYRPGPNLMGRTLHVVPVLGVVLVLLSRGAWGFGDGWVGAGLLLWAVAAAIGEMVLWPAERELGRVLAEEPDDAADAARRVPATRAALSSAAIVAVLITAAAVMVAKP